MILTPGERFSAPRWALLALLPLLTHCATAPNLEGIEPSHALPPAGSPPPKLKMLEELAARPDVNTVMLIKHNALAFGYRAATTASAQRTVDVQYYIWHDDLTGNLLAIELLRAAERGVRVRMLVDDIDARAKNDVLVVIDQHPKIEVRVFNPFYSRYGAFEQIGEAFTRGVRLNRRMHNKAWITDNQFAIVGGRNVGDEYFGASEHSNFSDLDVALHGPVVLDVSREFDMFWNSTYSVPVARLESKPPPEDALAILLEKARNYRAEKVDDPYIRSLLDTGHHAEMFAGMSAPVVANEVKVLSDDPSKIGKDSEGGEASNVLRELSRVTLAAHSELLIISPYFVPGQAGTDRLIANEKAGVRVAVLTNSLAATDVAAVHAGYSRYRKELIQSGIELFEMKRTAGSEAGKRQISVAGSSGASLHTKAVVVDRRWLYVGSMNLDPRSANLNTEMGVLIDDPALAEQLRAQFETTTSPDLSYRVEYEKGEGLVWYDRVDGKDRRLDDEPDASIGRRMSASMLRLLPIDSQL